MGIRERVGLVVSVLSVVAGCAGAAPPESDDDAQPGAGKQHPGAPTNPGAGGGEDPGQSNATPDPSDPPRACHTTGTISDLTASPILSSDPIYRISMTSNVL